MIPLSRSYPPSPPGQPVSEEVEEFLALCERVLVFEYSAAAETLQQLIQSGDDYDLIRLLEAIFQENFFTDMWVPREEYGRLVVDLDIHRTVLVDGPRGCGKSTLFYRLAAEMTSKDRDSLVARSRFLSTCTPVLLDIEPIVINSDVDRAVILEDIYTTLYNALEQIFLLQPRDDGEVVVDTVQRWLLFRIRKCAAFGGVREILIRRGLPIDGSGVDRVLEAINGPDLAPIVDAATQRYTEQSARDKVDDLLTFLVKADHPTRRLALLIDNVDWASPVQQDVIYEEVIRLHHRFGRELVLALNARTSTFLHFSEHNGGNLVGTRIRVGVESGVIAKVVTRRIALIRETLSSVIQIQNAAYKPKTVNDAIVVEHGRRQIEEFIGDDSFDEFLRLLAQFETMFCLNGPFIDDLSLWHNESIRSAARQFVRILQDVLVGRDPSGVRTGPMPRSASAGDARTVQLRHLCFGDCDLNEVPPLFDLVKPHDGKDKAPVLLALHVLEYLYQNARREVRWDELVALGAGYRVDQAAMFDALQELRGRRGFEAEGLVGILGGGRIPASGMPAHATVEIRPAGRFFVEHLSTSFEYLVWAGFFNGGFDTGSIEPRLAGRWDLEPALNRLLVAGAFVTDVLVPAFDQERHRFRLTDPVARLRESGGFDHVRKSHGGFGPFVIEQHGRVTVHFAERAVDAIAVQAQRIRTPGPSDDIMVSALVADAQRAVAELRRRVDEGVE